MIPNELRVGNLVSKGNEWFVTDFITIKMAHNYEPIPLTPEILEACGFVHDVIIDESYYKTDKFWVHHISEDWFISGDNDYISFKYLHQLQNLYFALTGQELKVNLHVKYAG